MKRIILLALAASLLTGCASWRSSTKPSATAPIILTELPVEARSCQGPTEITIPAGASVVAPDDLLKGWARDRKRLSVCKRVNESLISYAESLRVGFNSK